MPRKIPLSEKRNWLQLYDEGKSEASIAKDAHRDAKTIKKGINEARMERDSATARSALIMEALRKHQNSLLEVINRVLSALKVPPHNLEINREQDGSLAPIPLSAAAVKYDRAKGLVLNFQDENTAQWELLQEHLRREKLWNMLNHWKTAMIAHMQARMDLKLKTTMLLEMKTGLKVVEKVDRAPKARLIYPIAVGLFYEVALKRTLGIADGTNLEKSLVAISDIVQHGQAGSALAYAPGVTEECKESMLDAFNGLQVSTEANNAAATYREAEDLSAKARRAVEELSLLGLVPGQCRVCRRLGI